MVRRCWVNFRGRGALLVWTIVEQGPTALAVGADWGCLDIFSLIYHFSFLYGSMKTEIFNHFSFFYPSLVPLSGRGGGSRPTALAIGTDWGCLDI